MAQLEAVGQRPVVGLVRVRAAACTDGTFAGCGSQHAFCAVCAGEKYNVFYADNLDTLEDLGFLDSARALPGADVEGLRDLRMTLRARFRTEQRSHCNP